uniref:Actin maturation protease n=1 Tax=Parascaris univalens TaxID=6257 RepID=A0A915AMT2_PARUN
MAPILSALVEIRVDRLLEQLSTEESQCGAIAFLRDVGSILQNGPQCGLVALQMAAASFGLPSVDVQHIHRLAKERGFTNRGEMFSVDWLCELALLIWPTLRGTVEYMPTPERLTALLREQYAILVPYDCDKNNEPINRDGNAAHWCIVVGYLCPDRSQSQLIWSVQEPISHDNMHVFCLHGKSRHLALWKYTNLVESNANLNEIGDKRMTDGEIYVLPADGAAALKYKCLILHL